MVPGNLGCGVTVLAAMTILAPSRAARRPMALPIPRLAPVMNKVFPFKSGIFFRSPFSPRFPQQPSKGLDENKWLLQEQMMMRLWNLNERNALVQQPGHVMDDLTREQRALLAIKHG